MKQKAASVSFQISRIYQKIDEEKGAAGRDKEGASMYSSCENLTSRCIDQERQEHREDQESKYRNWMKLVCDARGEIGLVSCSKNPIYSRPHHYKFAKLPHVFRALQLLLSQACIHCYSDILPCDATATTCEVSLCHMRNLESDLALSSLTFSESSSFGSLALRCRVGFGGEASSSASSVFASWNGNMARETT